jgi:hypothetical protein
MKTQFNNSKRAASVGMVYLYTFLVFIGVYSLAFNAESIGAFIIDLGAPEFVQKNIEILIFGEQQI